MNRLFGILLLGLITASAHAATCTQEMSCTGLNGALKVIVSKSHILVTKNGHVKLYEVLDSSRCGERPLSSLRGGNYLHAVISTARPRFRLEVYTRLEYRDYDVRNPLVDSGQFIFGSMRLGGAFAQEYELQNCKVRVNAN